MTNEQFRVTDIQNIVFNGTSCRSFRVWKLDGDGFVHFGHFTAPIRTPKRDLLAFALEKIAFQEDLADLRDLEYSRYTA